MPWTSGGGGQGPWGGPPRGPRPPNLEDLLKGGQDRFKSMFPGGFWARRGFIIAALAAVLLWLATGIYVVQNNEQGVVLRFGAYNRTTPPGAHYHLPTPIESVITPRVTAVNQIDIGFQRTAISPRGGAPREIPEESLMLTGDENIVDINFTVFWVIKDAKSYLFNIRAPEVTVKAAAESAMREIIGQTPIADALAEGKGKIAQEAHDLLQRILDSYGAGIKITQVQLQKVDPPGPVIDAFRDVQRALADQERLRNEADGYRNDIIPRARGQAEQILQQADAYKQEVVARAQGDAARFISVDDAYQRAKDVTARRMYIETMEDILKNTKKVIIDRSASASGVVPYLPLPGLKPGSPSSSSNHGSAYQSAPLPSLNTSPSKAEKPESGGTRP